MKLWLGELSFQEVTFDLLWKISLKVTFRWVRSNRHSVLFALVALPFDLYRVTTLSVNCLHTLFTRLPKGWSFHKLSHLTHSLKEFPPPLSELLYRANNEKTFCKGLILAEETVSPSNSWSPYWASVNANETARRKQTGSFDIKPCQTEKKKPARGKRTRLTGMCLMRRTESYIMFTEDTNSDIHWVTMLIHQLKMKLCVLSVGVTTPRFISGCHVFQGPTSNAVIQHPHSAASESWLRLLSWHNVMFPLIASVRRGVRSPCAAALIYPLGVKTVCDIAAASEGWMIIVLDTMKQAAENRVALSSLRLKWLWWISKVLEEAQGNLTPLLFLLLQPHYCITALLSLITYSTPPP